MAIKLSYRKFSKCIEYLCNNRIFFSFQKIFPQLSVILRQLSDASTDLKAVLAAKIPKEQERVKNFRKNYGNQKVGEVTVDMVNE